MVALGAVQLGKTVGIDTRCAAVSAADPQLRHTGPSVGVVTITCPKPHGIVV